MIRKSVGLLALVAFLFVGLSYGAPIHQKAITPKEIANDSPSYIPQGRGKIHHLGVMKWGKGEVVVDTIQYCYDEPVIPMDPWPFATAYDSVWWQFRPIAEGTLMAVQGCFHTSGKAKVYVSHFLMDTCYYLMENDVPGRNPNLLPQELFWNITGNDDIWQTKDFMAYPGPFHIPITPDTSYVIGCQLDNTGHPFVNWDDPLTTMRITRPHDWRFSYGHATVNCDRNDPDWACLCYSENPDDTIRTAWYYIYYLTDPPTYPYIMLRAIVMYTPPIRPFMEDLAQLMDTYQTDVNFPVEAKLMDLNGTVTNAKLYWRVGGGAIDSSDMELSEGKATYWTAVGHIAGSFSYGDTVKYWCYGWDNDGMKSIWNGPGSEIKRFIIREPNPHANILLVNDFGTEKGEWFYKKVLDELGYQYSYWSVSDYHGIDNSVIEAGGWNIAIAIIFGQGTISFPGKDYSTDSLWVPFLEGGSWRIPHCILYIDQNYFCAHPEYSCEFDSSLGPGEFLYDYFGVREAKSDVSTRDTLFMFRDETTAGIFMNQMLAIYPDSVDASCWTDYTKARLEAVNLFFTALGGDSTGVRYERPKYRTVFLPFLLEAAINPITKEPSAEADTLIHRILWWFRPRDHVEEIPTSGELPKVFTLSQNHPNPFNPITRIEYTVPKGSEVILKIYNVLGQEVKTLVNQRQKAGAYRATWNGEDSRGQKVTSGIYFYKLKAGNFAKTRKMILLR